MEDLGNKKIIVVVVVIAIVALAFYFYSGSDNDADTPDVEGSEVNSENIGGEIFDEVGEGGEAVDKAVPKTNPFEAKGTNPFDSYKNPFE
jgi:beta-lactam-binding protein with PASTA domain